MPSRSAEPGNVPTAGPEGHLVVVVVAGEKTALAVAEEAGEEVAAAGTKKTCPGWIEKTLSLMAMP